MRTTIAERIDAEVPELEKIRRVSRGAILMTLVVGIAAMFVVSTFSNLDWSEIRQRARRCQLVVADLRVRDGPGTPDRRQLQHDGRVPHAVAVRPGVPAAVRASRSSTWPRRPPPAGSRRRCASSRSTACRRRPRSAPASSTAAASFAAQILLMIILFTFTDLNLSTLGGDRFDVDLRLLLIIVIVGGFIVGVLLAIPRSVDVSRARRATSGRRWRC